MYKHFIFLLSFFFVLFVAKGQLPQMCSDIDKIIDKAERMVSEKKVDSDSSLYGILYQDLDLTGLRVALQCVLTGKIDKLNYTKIPWSSFKEKIFRPSSMHAMGVSNRQVYRVYFVFDKEFNVWDGKTDNKVTSLMFYCLKEDVDRISKRVDSYLEEIKYWEQMIESQLKKQKQ